MSMRPGTVLALMTALLPLAATDYYVSPAPTGNNANAGTSSGAPVATIANALTKATSTGDRILLERGKTFREIFTLPANRTLTNYGSGALPVVTASETVTVSGAGVIKTATVASQARAVWADGVFLPLARYPNSGWLTCDAGSTSGLITDSGVSGRGANRSTGAQARWRRWSWWWETRAITADDGAGNLTLSGNALHPVGSPAAINDSGLVGIGSAYFIDNDLDELDADGEWFSSATTPSTLSIRPPSGTTTLELARSTTGITANGGTIDGIAFRRFGGHALTINNATTVRNCEFSEIEADAITSSWNSSGSLISGCTFRTVRNNGISWLENPGAAGGTVIERNRFENIGMQFGYGGSGPWHASGIIINPGKAVQIRLNTFIDVGYCGIILGTDGQTVERNVFVRCMGSLNDGAAIYANCNASVIRENIVLDTVGNLSTSHPWTPLGHGIWIEFLADFHDSAISNNTCYGNNGNGIFLPNNYTTTLGGNICLDNRTGGLLLSTEAGKPTSQNHSITNNVLGVVSPTRRQTWSENLESWGNPTTAALHYDTGIDYGSMSGTTFVVPTGQRLARTSGGADQNLATWQSANPSWADSGATLVAKNPILLFNDTETTAAIAVPGGTWTLLNNTAVGATVSVAPFRSVVLVPSGATTVPTSPPYYAASGSDYRAPLTAPVAATAPTITVNPADRTVTAPAAVGMSVAANGTSPLTYVWQRQPPGGGAWTTVAGATGPVINTVTSVADDGASYRCTVSNSAGSATSAAAMLTVLPAPAGSGGGAAGGGGGCGLGSGLAALALAFALGLRRALR